MKEIIRIIAVDDHLLFRLGLKNAFALADKMEGDLDYRIVGEAASSGELFRLLSQVDADVVLLDIVLPGESGIDIASRLREEYPQLKILMLSAESSESSLMQLLDIGIDGFISKAAPIDELLRAVDYVYHGAEYYGRDISRLIHCIHVARNRGEKGFTARELEIISMCAQGLMAKEIADRLCIEIGTVNVHKNNIFKKLGINSTNELIRYALKHKLIPL